MCTHPEARNGRAPTNQSKKVGAGRPPAKRQFDRSIRWPPFSRPNSTPKGYRHSHKPHLVRSIGLAHRDRQAVAVGSASVADPCVQPRCAYYVGQCNQNCRTRRSFSTHHQCDPFPAHDRTGGVRAMGGGWRDVGEAPPLSQGVGYGICLGKSVDAGRALYVCASCAARLAFGATD